jgi:hypothetical protein
VKTAYRLPVPLLVAGLALVVCGVRGSHSAQAAPATALAYEPPAITAMPSTHDPVRVAPAHPRRARASSHHPASASTVQRAAATPSAPASASPAASAASAKPAARPRPAATQVATGTVTGPTPWSALNAAIARIPTYRSGAARWVVSSKYDFWGTADWYHDVLYVDPGVPTDKLYDVAVHEWSHELSVLDYGGDVAAATRAMNATFGGSGLTGPERAADCMSILQGATWTHYTTCTNPAWRASAARLVAGKTLP